MRSVPPSARLVSTKTVHLASVINLPPLFEALDVTDREPHPQLRSTPLDILQIDLLDHQAQDEPRQVIFVDKLLNPRRQQHRLVDLPRAIALAHEQAESVRRNPASKIREFSDKVRAVGVCAFVAADQLEPPNGSGVRLEQDAAMRRDAAGRDQPTRAGQIGRARI
jgi:hypothetical protein